MCSSFVELLFHGICLLQIYGDSKLSSHLLRENPLLNILSCDSFSRVPLRQAWPHHGGIKPSLEAFEAWQLHQAYCFHILGMLFHSELMTYPFCFQEGLYIYCFKNVFSIIYMVFDEKGGFQFGLSLPSWKQNSCFFCLKICGAAGLVQGHTWFLVITKSTDLIQLGTPRTTSCPLDRNQRGKPSPNLHLSGSLEKVASEANPCHLKSLTLEFSQTTG